MHIIIGSIGELLSEHRHNPHQRAGIDHKVGYGKTDPQAGIFQDNVRIFIRSAKGKYSGLARE